MEKPDTIPSRPDAGGSVGMKIKVSTNYFPITVLDAVRAYQYDVKMEPECPMDVARRVFQQCETHLKKSLPKSWFVFDGLKIAYSTTSMDPWQQRIIVEKEVTYDIAPLQSSSGGRDRRPPRFQAPSLELKPAPILSAEDIKGKRLEVLVTIRQVSEIDLRSIIRHAKGEKVDLENIQVAATCLSVVLRYVPSLLYIPIGSNFYTSDNRVPISGGLEVWRGYHQSIRALMAGHLGVNVDIASTVFKTGGIDLLDYIQNVGGFSRPQDISRASMSELNKIVKGLKVVTSHRGDFKMRFTIAKLSKDNSRTMHFKDKNDQLTSVYDYFEREFDIKLRYPNLPLVIRVVTTNKGKNEKITFPMECLRIAPGQRFTQRLNGNQTFEVIKTTTQKPKERSQDIEDAVNKTLKFDKNEYIKSFGMKLNSRMMEVDARVLPAPRIVFRDNNLLNGKDGAWNLRGTKLVDTPELSSMAFIFFTKVATREANEVCDEILYKWKNTGMNISCKEPPVLVCNPGIPGNIKGSLMEAFKLATKKFKARCQLIVCILDGDKTLYEQIKTTALCEAGVLTQCMLSKHVYPARKIKDQYIANVALKIGGSSNYIDTPVSEPSTMFVGISISRPGPGSSLPALVALTASIDNEVTKHSTFLRAQAANYDIISDIEGLIKSALTTYKKCNGSYPKSIIAYRDGVASNRFQELVEKEVNTVLNAVSELEAKSKLTFIIFQKKHHTRLFPVDRNQDRSTNCLPGTVVDTSITYPDHFHFFLQSHAGIQGMSRPTSYHVLFDGNNFNSDRLQQTTFNLCFLSERATRSISIPSPAYRAGLAAAYAMLFVETRQIATSNEDKEDELHYSLRSLAAGMEHSMYYM